MDSVKSGVGRGVYGEWWSSLRLRDPTRTQGQSKYALPPGFGPGGGARNGGQRVFTPRQIPPDAAAVVIQQSGTTNTGQTDGGENAGRFCP